MSGYISILLMAIIAVASFTGGWEVRTWKYEASQEKAAIMDVNKAAQAQAAIIAKTQVVTKIITRVVHDKKNSCLTQPVDANLLQQLK